MKQVDVQFVNFWKGFNHHCYAFLELFQKRYQQQIVSNNPDVMLYAKRITRKPVPMNPHKFKNSVKVFYSGENMRPPREGFDFSFSYDDTSETNFLLPDFALTQYYFDFIKQTTPNAHQRQPKTNFCNFLYRNSSPQERIRFCKQLMKYKHVDCPGQVLNNMPNFTSKGRRSKDWWGDKINNIGKYKFTIAFENESAPNYITEKLFDPFYVGSIPIYWGAPNVTEFFDPNSFINVQDFGSFDEVIEYIKEINSNEELYQKIRETAPIHGSSRLKDCTEESIMERFDEIVQSIPK